MTAVRHKPLFFFGTCNLDYVLSVDRLPRSGGTVVGSFAQHPGGKGANQAVAAGRLGMSPRFFTKLGDDAAGHILLKSLSAAGVMTDSVEMVPGKRSGVAMIMVDATAANFIGIDPGENLAVSTADIARAATSLEPDSIVVAEMGLPTRALEDIFALKRKHGFFLIFNPAPVRAGLSAEAWHAVDIATPNETEAFELTGIDVVDAASATAAAHAVRELGPRAVAVTMGASGVVYVDAHRVLRIPSFEVDAVDTTAAGDAFNGGLAVALAREMPISEALRYAMAVAALSVTCHGAQESMPSAAQVASFLKLAANAESQ